jgi:hypothetical protein
LRPRRQGSWWLHVSAEQIGSELRQTNSMVCTILGGSFERRKCSMVTGLEVCPADQAVGHASRSSDLTEILLVMDRSREVLQIQLAPVSFYISSDRSDLLAMSIHILNASLAGTPDWLAAQSGHTPHGVTVMGAHRQSPSQLSRRFDLPRLK